MKVLGISSNYHDASAALVVDGKIVAAAAEERFTLLKHDPSFPTNSITFCLKTAGIRAEELDLVAYHEDPEVKFTRVLSSSFANFPRSRNTFVKSMRESVSGGMWIRNQISKNLDIHPNRVTFVPHHLSHAAHAFFTSDFDDAAILTIDAVGEWTSTAFFIGKQGATIAPEIKALGVVPFPHSLGLVYSAFTAFLGFKVNDGECSTMALAAFGRPLFASEVRKIIQIKDDGTYFVDTSFFDFSRDDTTPITQKFIDSFGQPRPYGHKLPFDCMEPVTNVDSASQRYADIAASIQAVLEEAVLALARKIKNDTQSRNLCLAGGVTLNCVANAKIVDQGLFENVYIPADPGDGGGAMGAALYAWSQATGRSAVRGAYTPYFGASSDSSEFIEMIRKLDPSRWRRYRDRSFSKPPRSLDVEVVSDFDELAEKIAHDLPKTRSWAGSKIDSRTALARWEIDRFWRIRETSRSHDA